MTEDEIRSVNEFCYKWRGPSTLTLAYNEALLARDRAIRVECEANVVPVKEYNKELRDKLTAAEERVAAIGDERDEVLAERAATVMRLNEVEEGYQRMNHWWTALWQWMVANVGDDLQAVIDGHEIPRDGESRGEPIWVCARDVLQLLKEHLAVAEERAERLEGEVARLQKQLAEAQSEVDKLADECDVRLGVMDDLRADLEGAKHNEGVYEARWRVADEARATLRAQLAEVKKVLNAFVEHWAGYDDPTSEWRADDRHGVAVLQRAKALVAAGDEASSKGVK